MAVERWTDEMLDELASSVADLRESVAELRGGMGDLQESVADLRDGVDGIRITAQALLQVAAQSQRETELLQQRQAENDERFNVLLEEVRYLIRRNDREE